MIANPYHPPTGLIAQSCRLSWGRGFHFAARSTLIHSISSLNGPAFLSPNMKPRALISSGLTSPAS